MYSVATCLKKSEKNRKKLTTRREKTYKNSNPVRQFIMAPAPSLSSRRCCRQGPLRTMSPPCPPSIASGSKHRRGGPSKHVNQSVVSSLHRTAEASVAVEGLRNTYFMSVAIAMSYPHRPAEASIAVEGLRNTSLHFQIVAPLHRSQR